MPDEEVRIVIEGDDRLSRPARQASAALGGLSASASKAHSVVAGLGKVALGFGGAMLGINAASAAFSAAKDAVIGFNARMEQSKIGWTTMLKSGRAAEQMLEDLQRFAAKTPFEFPELEQASRRLLAMGFQAKEIIPLMTDLGNAASALGMSTEGINRLTLALGQMRAKSKVSGEEMRQLAEAGIPAWQILAEAMGKPIPVVMKLSEQGKIASDVFIRAFQQFSQQNWGGMMQAQSRTFLGALSTIRDSLTMVAASGFKPLFDRMSDLARNTADFVSSADFERFGRQVSTGVQMAMDVLGLFGSALKGTVTVIGTVTGGAYLLVKSLADLGGTWENLTNYVRNEFDPAFREARARMDEVRKSADELGLSLASLHRQALPQIEEGLTGIDQNLALRNQSIYAGDVANAMKNATNETAEFATRMYLLEEDLKKEQRLIREQAQETRNLAAARREAATSFGRQVVAAPTEGDLRQEMRDMRGLGETVGWVGSRINYLSGEMGKLREAQALYGESSAQARAILAGMSPEIRNLTSDLQGLTGEQRAAAVSLLGDHRSLQEGWRKVDESAAKASERALAKLEKMKMSVQQIVSAFITLHPATAAVAAETAHWQGQIDSVNLALVHNGDQMRAAQAELSRMSERLSGLNSQLSEAKQRLGDLSAPRLKGMGALEDQLFALEQQSKKLQLAKLLGTAPGDVDAQIEALRKQMEVLKLQGEVQFDEPLRKLKAAAEGTKPELTFAQALSAIKSTKAEIASLTGQIGAQEAAMRAQQGAINGLQAASEAMNRAMQEYQKNLQESERKQQLLSKALELGMGWLLEGRKKFTDLGGEGVRVAGVIDEKARAILMAVSGAASETSAISSTTLAEMVKNYEEDMAAAVLHVASVEGALKNIPPPIIESIKQTNELRQSIESLRNREITIRTNYVNYHYDLPGGAALPPGISGRQHGGPVTAGRAYLVGERGPEPFIPNVSGTILPNSSLRNGIAAGIDYDKLAAAMERRPVYVTMDGRIVARILRDHHLETSRSNGGRAWE